MKKYLIALAVLFTPFIAMAAVNPTPSTNADNELYGWAFVSQESKGVGTTTLKFTSTRNFFSCFEYRTDGDVSQRTATTSYNPLILDGLYPFKCVKNASSTKEMVADEYVEVRMVFGAESDERFDWTRFEVDPKPVVSTPSSPSNSKKGGGGYASASYYGFTSEADKVRFANYDERQKMLGQWRFRMCQEYGFACGK